MSSCRRPDRRETIDCTRRSRPLSFAPTAPEHGWSTHPGELRRSGSLPGLALVHPGKGVRSRGESVQHQARGGALRVPVRVLIVLGGFLAFPGTAAAHCRAPTVALDFRLRISQATRALTPTLSHRADSIARTPCGRLHLRGRRRRGVGPASSSPAPARCPCADRGVSSSRAPRPYGSGRGVGGRPVVGHDRRGRRRAGDRAGASGGMSDLDGSAAPSDRAASRDVASPGDARSAVRGRRAKGYVCSFGRDGSDRLSALAELTLLRKARRRVDGRLGIGRPPDSRAIGPIRRRSSSTERWPRTSGRPSR